MKVTSSNHGCRSMWVGRKHMTAYGACKLTYVYVEKRPARRSAGVAANFVGHLPANLVQGSIEQNVTPAGTRTKSMPVGACSLYSSSIQVVAAATVNKGVYAPTHTDLALVQASEEI